MDLWMNKFWFYGKLVPQSMADFPNKNVLNDIIFQAKALQLQVVAIVKMSNFTKNGTYCKFEEKKLDWYHYMKTLIDWRQKKVFYASLWRIFCQM